LENQGCVTVRKQRLSAPPKCWSLVKRICRDGETDAIGPKQTWRRAGVDVCFGPEADILTAGGHVRFSLKVESDCFMHDQLRSSILIIELPVPFGLDRTHRHR
jgi:hypothetical protein